MQNFKETRLIHCYDMLSFVVEIEKAVKDGFSLDLVTQEHHPVQIGYQLICTVVKEVPCELNLKLEVDTTEVKKVITEAVEGLKTLKEASESTQEGAGSQEVTKEVVEAPKRGRKAGVK